MLMLTVGSPIEPNATAKHSEWHHHTTPSPHRHYNNDDVVLNCINMEFRFWIAAIYDALANIKVYNVKCWIECWSAAPATSSSSVAVVVVWLCSASPPKRQNRKAHTNLGWFGCVLMRFVVIFISCFAFHCSFGSRVAR